MTMILKKSLFMLLPILLLALSACNEGDKKNSQTKSNQASDKQSVAPPIKKQAVQQKASAKTNTILVLNYLHASLNKIILYNNKIVLDHEYENIINNLNFSAIEDKKLINVITDLMDTLSEFKLKEIDKERLQQEYEHSLERTIEEKAYAATKNIVSNIKDGEASDALGAGVAVVTGLLSEILFEESIKQKQDNQKWELKKSTLIELNKIRKTFLITYWELLKKHGIPDRKRITEVDFKRFIKALKNKNPQTKYNQLIRMKEIFSQSLTYWFELSLASHQLGNKKEELAAVEKYNELNNPKLLRKDKQYSLMLANKLTYLNPTTDVERIKNVLSELNQTDPDNPERKLIRSLAYESIGEVRKAEELLQENIEDDYFVKVSEKMKLSIYIKNNQEKKYKFLLKDLLQRQQMSIFDELNYLGEYPVELLAKDISKKINGINISIQDNLLDEEDLIIKVPKNWVLKEFQKAHLFIDMADIHHKKYDEVEINNGSIVYTFKEIIDQNLFKNKNISSIYLTYRYRNMSIRVKFLAKIINSEGVKVNNFSIDTSDTNWINGAFLKSKNKYNKYKSRLEFAPTKLFINKACFDLKYKVKPCHKGGS